MHLHKWGMWADKQLINCYDYEANGKPDGQKMRQERRCITCGRLKSRTVKLW